MRALLALASRAGGSASSLCTRPFSPVKFGTLRAVQASRADGPVLSNSMRSSPASCQGVPQSAHLAGTATTQNRCLSSAAATSASRQSVQPAKLCVSVSCDDLTSGAAAEALKEAQIAELRLTSSQIQQWSTDMSKDGHLARSLIERSAVPVICKLSEECCAAVQKFDSGGSGSEQSGLVRLLDYILQSGAQYIELPATEATGDVTTWQKDRRAARGATAEGQLIVDHSQVPGITDTILQRPQSEMKERAEQLAAESPGDIIKLSVRVNSVMDSAALLQLTKHITKPYILETTEETGGQFGLPTRGLASKFGCFLTYNSPLPRWQLADLAKAAPVGYPTLRRLRDAYRLHTQTPSTKVFGIAGDPVAHDLGYLLHNKFFEASGMDAVYLPLLVHDMRAFLKTYGPGMDVGGFSVTMPHKATALALAKEKDPIAVDCGASNTLVALPGGGFSGHNTDWLGAIGAIEAGLAGDDLHNSYARAASAGSAPGGSGGDGRTSPLKGSSVVVMGCGGAGSAIAFGAVHAGAKVYLADNVVSKAENLAKRLGGPNVAQSISMDLLSKGDLKANVLANATPAGMMPNVTTSAIAREVLPNFEAVLDALYTPMQTQLLKDAAAEGCIPISGLEMFLGQAAEQYRLFTGGQEPPPASDMRKFIVDYISTL